MDPVATLADSPVTVATTLMPASPSSSDDADADAGSHVYGEVVNDSLIDGDDVVPVERKEPLPENVIFKSLIDDDEESTQVTQGSINDSEPTINIKGGTTAHGSSESLAAAFDNVVNTEPVPSVQHNEQQATCPVTTDNAPKTKSTKKVQFSIRGDEARQRAVARQKRILSKASLRLGAISDTSLENIEEAIAYNKLDSNKGTEKEAAVGNNASESKNIVSSSQRSVVSHCVLGFY